VRDLSSALHPLTTALAFPPGRGRAAQAEQWTRVLGPGAPPPPLRLLAEQPLVASHELQAGIELQLGQLLSFLHPHMEPTPVMRATWPSIKRPDVLSVDLAIVEDLTVERGWSLRWVEFQGFTSIVASLYTLHMAAQELLPPARDLAPCQSPPGGDWLRALTDWVAPGEAGIVLENSPQAQATLFDLNAAARLFNRPLVDPAQLLRTSSQLSYRDADGRAHPVERILNRSFLHEVAHRAAFEHLASAAPVHWHSHPAWYDGISKALLAQMPQPAGLRCTTADRWRELGLPATALVAKNIHSYGGAAVHLHVEAAWLDGLADASHWLVQPRYTPHALFSASDGHPVWGEVRCIVALPENSSPWIAAQVIRLSRTAKVSAAGLNGTPGTGLSLLYRPDGL